VSSSPSFPRLSFSWLVALRRRSLAHLRIVWFAAYRILNYDGDRLCHEGESSGGRFSPAAWARTIDEAPNPPRWEVFATMAASTLLVVSISGLADLLGRQLSGLVSNTPVFISIFGAFTHRFSGRGAVVQFIRGVVVGSFSFATFFLVMGRVLAILGVLPAFGLAPFTAISLNWFFILLARRRT
jgi:hypothetical protein